MSYDPRIACTYRHRIADIVGRLRDVAHAAGAPEMGMDLLLDAARAIDAAIDKREADHAAVTDGDFFAALAEPDTRDLYDLAVPLMAGAEVIFAQSVGQYLPQVMSDAFDMDAATAIKIAAMKSAREMISGGVA